MSADLARQIEQMARQAAGRVYRVKWQDLDEESQREVIRLLRDLESEHQSKLRAQQRMPWRRL